MPAKAGTQNRIWLGRLSRYGPLVFWIGVIFYFSSSFGSFSETSRFIRPLLEFLFPAATAETLTIYHGYVRKSAHFAAYAVLGLAASAAFLPSSRDFLRRHWFTASLLLIGLIAVLDELNQSYSRVRTGSIYDVVIDVAGGLTALTLVFFAVRRRSAPKT